jgi:diaminopimelate epimerase
MTKFVKAHACGNDFLIIEEAAAGRRHAELAKRLCARNTGVGADGIEVLERRANGNFFLRLFNSDGSEAELSGNGTRCVAAWLAHSEQLREVSLGTHGGVRTCRVLSSDGAMYQVESGMGVPRVLERTIVVAGVGNVLKVDTDDFRAHGLAWEDLGKRISTSPLFPHGTNVEFVRVRSTSEIDFRIYERGCGPTTSSGTGTCASATAAIALWGVWRELVAVAPGGAQKVVWPANSEQMMLTGPAEIVCVGEVYL